MLSVLVTTVIRVVVIVVVFMITLRLVTRNQVIWIMLGHLVLLISLMNIIRPLQALMVERMVQITQRPIAHTHTPIIEN